MDLLNALRKRITLAAVEQQTVKVQRMLDKSTDMRKRLKRKLEELNRQAAQLRARR